MTEFTVFPKIARLFRDMVVTEKIDGTNAAVGIIPFYEQESPVPQYAKIVFGPPDGMGLREAAFVVYAQSRKRIITPAADNFGFAQWVYDNADSLVLDLGEGLHFGEWWGSGIQRGYGLPKGEKRFSLFNVKRWTDTVFYTPGVNTVPVLYRGGFNTDSVEYQLSLLEQKGSQAAPGFMNPEGIVVYHTAGNVMFKATIHGDEKPKSLEE